MAETMNFMRRLFFFLSCFCFSYGGEYIYGSVYCRELTCKFAPNVLDTEHATAYGTYNDTLLETGWGILDIKAGFGKDSVTNDELMYAAGYLEGVLTQKRIYQHFQNLYDWFTPRIKSVEKVKDFFNTQDVFMRSMIDQKVPSDPLWRHVSYILSQYDGLFYGYNQTAPSSEALDIFAFQVLNGNGDLLDLVNALNPESVPDWRKMSHSEAQTFVMQNSRCSALVKVLGAYEDLFMSHSSWFIYQATMRIYKHYNFNVKDDATAAKQMSFSSYPGFLESLDDFYLLSSKMVMLQTTNNVFNTSLYKLVSPKTLLAWQRVRVANMMAHGGKEWGQIMSMYNSGTYNNQYMVIDLKKIEIGKSINDGALWVVEQIPGLVEFADTTPILRTGYWPSYNVPYFERVYNLSGYPQFVATHGLDFSYQLAPRAKIFRRDEGTVKNMDTMKKIMRYNDYKEDPYSEGNACNAICCRGDLRKEGPSPSGCYDTKVSNYQMAMQLQADILNGPTLGTDLPPFAWDGQFKTASHVGLPESYSFSFMSTAPRWRK